MNRLRLVVVMAAVTAMDAAEPMVTEPVVTEPVVTEPVVTEPVASESVTTKPESAVVPGQAPVELADFIVPFASDLRVGYVLNAGRYHRSQSGGEGTDDGFLEHGVWAGYVFALSGPGRVLSGRSEWRSEIGVLFSQGDVTNPNGSTGTLRTLMLDLGIGPSWELFGDDTNRLELEVMSFVGVGLSQYRNKYDVDNGGALGFVSIEASGFNVEYGIKANLLWCWGNGWGAALNAGLVQRLARLEGDTSLGGGAVSDRSDYVSDDTMTGVRFGLFVTKRF